MRIRLHKSRTTTAIMVVSSLVIISGVAAGASETLNKLFSNSQGGIEKPVNEGNNSGTNSGKDCLKGNKGDTPTNLGNGSTNASSNGNQQASDCITDKKNQTVTISKIGNQNVLTTINVSATASSGLTISRFSAGGVCTISTTNGNSATVTLTGFGTCSVTATQDGNSEFNSDSDSTSFQVIDDTDRRFVCLNGQRVTNESECPSGPSGPRAAVPTASPLPVSRIIVPRLLNLTTTYNGRSQGVSYSVEPTNANCRVTYNGSTARPTNAGSYSVAIVCRDGRLQGGATGTFVINKAPTTLNWFDPNPITTADELSKVQLNAKANVPGTYTYEEKVGQALPAGTHELNVDFTPRDTNNYLPSSADVNIDVLKYANKFAPIKVPFNLSSAGLTAKTRPIVSKLFLSEDVKEITVYGYVKPSNSKSADMKLSLARAKTVAAQIKGISPDLKINVKAMGAIINPACKAYSNKCVIVK